MSGLRRRRDPDPARPGTIYRSKPKLGRTRNLSSGPPYLGGSDPRPPVGSDVTPPTGVGSVYRDYGGDPAAAGQYGRVVDDPGHDPAFGQSAPGYGDPYAAPGRSGYPGAPGGGYPGGPPPGGPRPGGPGRGGGGRSLRQLPRPRLSLIILVLVVVLVGYPLLLGFTAWHSLNRVDALAPAHAISDTTKTPGRTFLVVGSDNRSDLTAAERKKLGTGTVAGQRTDTIILLHVPAGGGPTVLVSVPRDSYVPIPGHGQNKINAAFAFGGAPLLVRTLEAVTGLRIDEYVQTDLGGFADIVDALGGVVLCPKFNMDDHDAHINLKKGCQQMNGKTALGYARARHSDPRGDLGRVERQRETLAAIAKKMLSPVTLVQPWRALPAAKSGGTALTVDKGMTPLGLVHFLSAMRAVAGGKGLSLTVPVSNPDLRTPAGSSVEWNRTEALKLFADIKADDTTAIKSIAKAQQ